MIFNITLRTGEKVLAILPNMTEPLWYTVVRMTDSKSIGRQIYLEDEHKNPIGPFYPHELGTYMENASPELVEELEVMEF